MKNMTRRKQLKLEKKNRKKKLERREANAPPLAYDGNKYRKDRYVPIFLAAETAILEAFVITDRRMTDADVREGLTTLIEWLRKGLVPRLADLSAEQQAAYRAKDFLVSNILEHWKRLFERCPSVPRDVLVGVLRTTLSSIDCWGSKGPRGYLLYIEDFLGKSGIEVCQVSREEFDSMQIEPIEQIEWKP
ncbi:MAG TPA: hypothetical protein VJL29_13805 [Thermoguttaceae bacterium]|nr:hypothetical protein [Thermoguttaceae bacterium]